MMSETSLSSSGMETYTRKEHRSSRSKKFPLWSKVVASFVLGLVFDIILFALSFNFFPASLPGLQYASPIVIPGIGALTATGFFNFVFCWLIAGVGLNLGNISKGLKSQHHEEM